MPPDCAIGEEDAERLEEAFVFREGDAAVTITV
jgi:hypothetical protein